MTYETLTTRLTEIVSTLGAGRTSLNDSLRLFEEGMQLVREADQVLGSVERRAVELMGGPEQSVDERPR